MDTDTDTDADADADADTDTDTDTVTAAVAATVRITGWGTMEGMSPPNLTEDRAARLWALAYNSHEVAVLEHVLADDIRVMSRWVVNDLVGRDAYLAYLRGKFATFEQTGSVVRVELGRTPGSPGRSCAVLEQDGVMLATVLFDVVGGRLARISLGPNPPPESCLRSGEFPGFGADEALPVN
jgi:hypothetical protein